MLLPIGLAVGTITSLVHHLRQNDENESQEEYTVAVVLNAKDLQSAMEHALLFGKRNLTTEIGRTNTQAVRRSIQGVVSPGGTGLQFTEEKSVSADGENFKRTFTEIQGSNKHDIVAVVIELVGERGAADAAKLGIAPAVIRSLSEAQPLSSIRFILTPETLSPSDHASSLAATFPNNKKKIKKLIVLKEQESVQISDIDGWKSTDSNTSANQLLEAQPFIEITHPVLLKKPVEIISTEFTKSTLEAADQLRNIILKAAN